MEEQNRGFQAKLNEWLLKVSDFVSLQIIRLLRLLQQIWKWYRAIDWPEIPLTPMQWVLSFYVVFAIVFMVSTPIFEASDELWHFGMVDYLRENDGALPEYDVSDPDAIYENNLDTVYRQEGSQPPLYYYTMALLSSPISIADADDYREPNPHARAGEPSSWGNKNLVLHSTDGVPLSGTPLAVFVMRLFGIAMGCVTIFAVWRVGELIAPHRPVVGLLAATLTAFNPMFLFISASVNNDVMVIMLNSVVILLGLQTLREGFDTRRSVLLAVLLALATLTKLSALVLVPVIAIAGLWVARRDKDWTGVLILGGTMLVAWATISGWWYVRNIQLYGELFGTQTMAAVAGARPGAFTFGTFFSEFEGFRQSYWGVFGAFNIIVSPLFYALMDFIVFVGIFGVIFLVAQLSSIQDFSFARREISLMLYLLGIVLIGIIAYLNWTSQTFASQGRLLFPYFAAISPLLAVGLIEVLWWMLFLLSPPDRSYVRAGDAVPEPILRESLQWPLRILGLIVFTIPFLTIMPQYRAPQPIAQENIPSEAETLNVTFDSVQLIGYEHADRRYFPNDWVRITLYWRVIEQTEEDATLALAFINPAGDVISNRTISTFPGAGTLRTSEWEPGAIYADTYEIRLGNNITGRFPFALDVNWYVEDPDERIQALNNDDNPIEVILDVGAAIQPNARPELSELEIPSDGNTAPRLFNNEILMDGFGYSTVSNGELAFNVDVLWEAQRALDQDYITFMHIYDAEGVLITQDDFQPSLPTPYWTFREGFRLQYFVDPPENGFLPGEYTVNVGWYFRDDPSERLLIEADTENQADTLELFTFTVTENESILLPVLDTGQDLSELPGIPVPPEVSEDDPEETVVPFVEITAEVMLPLPELTGEAGITPEPNAEATQEADAAEATEEDDG